MKLPVKIASRSSALALAQVEEIIRELKAHGHVLDAQILKINTAGDSDKTTPLTDTPDDFFTDAIDQALLEEQADIAVHSAKDLPQNLHEDLKIFALTKGRDPRDAWVGRVHWKNLPLGGKVGTSSILRQKQVLEMRPDVTLVNIRGTISERLQLIKESKVDGIVVALCALKRLKLELEIMDILPWEGMPLQGQLAVVGRRNDTQLGDLFKAIDVRLAFGRVTLVGAGPGDIELMTLKGIKALQGADCVFYDYLVDAGLLKYAPHAEHIYVGKRKGEHSLSQEELSRMLREKAFAGKNVVRLKGGDPLIFGRGADEIQYLRSYHIEVDVIPGICSATGIPSSLGVPLTARGVSSSVVFLSGHEEDENKDNPRPLTIPQADTLVFLMGLTKLSIIVRSLQGAGWPMDTAVMIISNGTRPQEQIVKGTLSTIEDIPQVRDLKPPALIVVGEVVEFYKPYFKQTFLHCGTHPELYRHMGNILHWPMIDIRPASLSESDRRDFFKSFGSADIIICTSPYAAEYFLKELTPVKPPVNFGEKIFAVIGQRTQQVLEEHNIRAAVVSHEETAQGLFKAMSEKLELKGKRILYPRSSLPNPFLKGSLQAHGALVTEVTIYENTKPAKRDLPSAAVNGVIFTSPSTVRNFLADYGTIPASWLIMAKGPVTLKALQEEGYNNATSLS